MFMICLKCGTSNDGLNKFCTNCGNDLHMGTNYQEAESSNQTDVLQTTDVQKTFGPQTTPGQQPPFGQQQFYSQQPAFGQLQQTYNAPYNPQGEGPAIASVVCGIVGLVAAIMLCCVPIPISLVLGIIAVIMSRIAANRGDVTGRATAGLILGIITIVITALMIFLLIFIIALDTSANYLYSLDCSEFVSPA